MLKSSFEIERMDPTHWHEVQEIYKTGMETGIATFETNTPSWEKWNESHLQFGRFIAKIETQIAGWAALSPVSTRLVYKGVAEVSVYVHENFQRRGIGEELLKKVINDSEENNIWTLQSSIFRENKGSIELHEKLGFRVIGFREKIAMRNGEWKDNFILERRSKLIGI